MRGFAIKLTGAALLLALSTSVGLLEPASASGGRQGGTENPGRSFWVKARRIYFLDESHPFVENGWFHVQDGRIDARGKGHFDPKEDPVLDYGEASIIPGLVSMQVGIFEGLDQAGLGARYRAADKFNPYADFRRVWEYGITAGRLPVPTNRFIGGIGAVAHFGGNADDARILLEDADLLVNFNDNGGRGEQPESEIPIPSSSEQDYGPDAPRRPQTRMGRIDALADAIKSALDLSVYNGFAKDAPARDAKALALGAFLHTGRPLRLDARRSTDVTQAVEAISRLGLKAYLYGLDDGERLAHEMGKGELSIVVEINNDLDADSIDPDPVRPIRRDPALASKLAARGHRVALCGRTDDLLLAAAIAKGAGLDARRALLAVTSEPAHLLGVGSEVGRLEAGYWADFAVVNGDPLATRSHIQETWVAGRRAWTQAAGSQALVVRAGRILDGSGQVIDDGEVLIENGRVTACGHRVPHPKSARVIDAGPHAVVTPGFIDVNGSLLLEGDGTSAGAELDISKIFQIKRDGAKETAAGGVTTVVVGPLRANPAGSRMAAVKSWGADLDLVTSPLAAVKIAPQGDSNAIETALENQLKQAKGYFEQWKKYEAELEAWKKGQATGAPAPAAAEAQKPEEKKEPAKKEEAPPVANDDPISGTWDVKFSGGPFEQPIKGVGRYRLDGKSVSGMMTDLVDTSEESEVQGSFDGKALRLTLDRETPFGKPILDATLTAPERLEGSIDLGGVVKIKFEGNRTSKAAPKIKVSESAQPAAAAKPSSNMPKKPRRDDRLEAWRAVFAGKAGVIAETAGGPAAVRTVLQAFSKYGLPVVIADSANAHWVKDDFKPDQGAAISGNLTRADEDGRSVLIPDDLDRAGIPIVFQSANRGNLELLRVARAAVRDGLSPETALRALTLDAARLLRLDQQVGSLQKGRDGDILIFNGDPFEVGTRLVSVFVRGKEVK